MGPDPQGPTAGIANSIYKYMIKQQICICNLLGIINHIIHYKAQANGLILLCLHLPQHHLSWSATWFIWYMPTQGFCNSLKSLTFSLIKFKPIKSLNINCKSGCRNWFFAMRICMIAHFRQVQKNFLSQGWQGCCQFWLLCLKKYMWPWSTKAVFCSHKVAGVYL